MTFTLIKGWFQPQTGIPDGDSVRIKVANRDLVFRLRQNGRLPKINDADTVTLRYEAIDAMEKSALKPYSSNATARHLELIGAAGGPGYVLSRQLDGNGRPVAFVFVGETPEPDGQVVFLSPDRLLGSVNYRLVAEGHAYPMYYETLFADLRQVFSDATAQARKQQLGVHAADASGQGIVWTGLAGLGQLPPIFPKLYRRLEDYATHRDYRDIAGNLDSFIEFLRFMKPERVFLTEQATMTGFDNVLEVSGDRVRLLHKPETLVFRP